MGKLSQHPVQFPGKLAKIFKCNSLLLRKSPLVKSLQGPNGTLLHDAGIRTELFATTMQSQFSTPSHESVFENKVRETLANQSVVSYVPITFFSPGETWDVIRKQPNRRAPGQDRITNCALIYCDSKTITRLCNIYNWCLRTEFFPTK